MQQSLWLKIANYNNIQHTSIEIHNLDGAQWIMKCYTGDSGTGRISFEDLNLGSGLELIQQLAVPNSIQQSHIMH